MDSASASGSEEEYQVEKVVNYRMKAGKREFLISWKGYPESENSWEPEVHMSGSRELVEDFLRDLELQKNDPKNQKAKAKKPKSSGDGEQKRGFDRGLTASKIIGACQRSNALYYLVEWEGSNEMDLESAIKCNERIPQLVIAFFEERLVWVPKEVGDQ